MPEYNIGFSEKLIDAARVVAASTANTIDGQRTVLYLSLLASEIALKAFLERAGFPIQDIRNCSHSHRALLDAICHCEVEDEIVPGQPMWLPASRVCAIPVSIESGSSTVGTLLTLEQNGASRYPNEIRYGDSIAHAPAIAILQASEKLYEWVTKFIGSARRRQNNTNSDEQRGSETKYRRRDTYVAATKFCEAYGGGLKVGDELEYSSGERNERGQDYWIGYELIDFKGKKCGEITAGYVGYIADVRAYAAINIDGEVIESEAQSLDKVARHNRENNEQPKELKVLLIKVAERATRRVNGLRGA